MKCGTVMRVQQEQTVIVVGQYATYGIAYHKNLTSRKITPNIFKYWYDVTTPINKRLSHRGDRVIWTTFDHQSTWIWIQVSTKFNKMFITKAMEPSWKIISQVVCFPVFFIWKTPKSQFQFIWHCVACVFRGIRQKKNKIKNWWLIHGWRRCGA